MDGYQRTAGAFGDRVRAPGLLEGRGRVRSRRDEGATEAQQGAGEEVFARVLEILLVAVAYYVAARFSLRLALVERNVTPLWPPTGIALVAFLVFGRRIWPGVAVAAFLANGPITASLWAAGATAAGNTLAPFVAALLLRRAGFRRQLDRLRDAIAIVVLAALLAMAISASVGSGTLVLSGAIPASDLPAAWAVWWTGDATGILFVAPFLLSLLLREPKTSWRRRAEAGALFLSLGVVSVAVMHTSLEVMFLVFPFLGWAAWRFQQRGAAPAALLVAGAATWAAAQGTGPFEGGTLFANMLTLQAFNATVALASFFFAAVVTERMRAREVLKRSAAELEEQVRERTAELLATNRRLIKEEEALRESLALLRKTDEQRRQLLSRLLTAQQEERARIAADIHDDSLQVVTAVGLRIATLRRSSDREREADLAKLEETVAAAVVRLRQLVFELLPGVLEEEGLVPALREHLRTLRDETGIEASLDDYLPEEPPQETRAILYRIAKEAFSNVRKHSRAGRVSVILQPQDHGVLVRIEDDGIGFDPEADDGLRPGHLGLIAMRERAEMTGGRFHIQSEPGRTRVEFWVPVATGSDPAPQGKVATATRA